MWSSPSNCRLSLVACRLAIAPRVWWAWAAVVALLATPEVLWAAQQAPPPATTTTRLVIQLAAGEAVAAQSRFQTNPPTVIISFPPRRVLATLPEPSLPRPGAGQETAAASALASSHPAPSRWLRSLRIQLRGRYRYALRSEPGRILIEIEHPATVTGETIEVKLLSAPSRLSERFAAMQHALFKAQPSSPSLSERQSPPRPSVEQMAASRGSLEAGAKPAGSPRLDAPDPSPPTPTEPGLPLTTWWWVLIAVGVIGGASRGWRLVRSRRWSWALRRLQSRGPLWPSAVALIDQLVWQAFERQGYQPLHTVELGGPLGLMRVVLPGGQKAAPLCVGNGALFEKSTVEQFVRSIRGARVDQGVLVAPGAFTMPAQRYAAAQHVSLLGRDQLVELIGAAAMTASYATQLEGLTQQLTEAKGTIEQYGQQLDLLRRQRNEASWYLGEERVKTSQLESRLDELTHQVQQWQAQAPPAPPPPGGAQKQREESQWYLGEARSALDHLQAAMQELRQSFEELNAQHRQAVTAMAQMQGQRDEASRHLEEAERLHETLQQQIHQLEERAQRARAELETEQTRRATLEEELQMVRNHWERRTYPRISPETFNVELDDYSGSPLYRGGVRDLSLKGFGVETPVALECPATLPVRARLTWRGREAPLESDARLVWKRQDAATHRHQQGFALEGMPEQTVDLITRAFPALQPSWMAPAFVPRPRPARRRAPRRAAALPSSS